METFKRIVALLIAVVLVVLSFSACDIFESPKAKVPFTEDKPGEIFFAKTDESNIKKDVNGVEYADNEVLVVAKPNVKKSEVEKLAKSYNAQIVGYIEVSNDYQWRLNTACDYDKLVETVELIQKEEIIEIAYLNNFHETKTSDYVIPNDKKWEGLWDLYRPEGNNWGAEALYAPFVWQYNDYLTPVRVGLMDSMFNTIHNDVAFAETFYNPENITNAHGTHVAGTMAATYNNGEGITGIYPYGKNKDQKNNIYGVALKGTNKSDSLFLLKAGLAELIVRDVKVINISMGFLVDGFLAAKDEPGYREKLTKGANILGSFLEGLLDKGYDFVISQAAGNSRGYHFAKKNGDWINVEKGKENGYATDADLKGAIAGSDYNNLADWDYYFSIINNERVKDRIIVVGAASYNQDQSNTKYTIADFSNTGERVDAIAPGVKIESASLGADGYSVMSGTSMAAPHVAGAAATVWSFNPNLDGSHVKKIIKNSTLGSFQEVSGTDKRMVNLLAAMASASEGRVGGNPFKNSSAMALGRVYVGGKLADKCKISVLEAGSDKEVETVSTDANGSYNVTLPAGKYKFLVSLDEYAPNLSEEVTLSNGSVVYLDDVYLKSYVKSFDMTKDLVVTLGEIGVIEPEIAPADSSYTIKWTSSNESVATVSPNGEAGIITTLTKGTTIITAELTSGEKTITKTTNLRVASKARDTVLVLDISGSMYGEPLEEMKKSAIQFCNDLLKDEYNNRVGIVFYDDRITTIDLTDDLDMLISYIQSIREGGRTDMEGGLSAANKMLKNGSKADSVKNVVVMADGLPNEGKVSSSGSMPVGSYSGYYTSVSYANAVIDTAKQMMNNYNLYSLGFFHGMYNEEKDFATALMKELTNQADGYHQVDKAEDLQFAFGDISEDINVGSKIVINIACPVDVCVTYGGEMLSSSSNAFCNATSFGTLQLLGKNKDIKVVSLDSGKEYEIKLVGTGVGKMDYSVNYFDDKEVLTDYRSFETVPITKTTIIESNTNNSANGVSLNIDEDGDGEVDVIWTAMAKGKGEITYEKNPPKPEESKVEEPKTEGTPVVEKEEMPVWAIVLICAFAAILIGGGMVVIVVSSKRNKTDTDFEFEIPENAPEDIIKCSRCGRSHPSSQHCKCLDEKVKQITENTEKSAGFIQVTNGSMAGFSIPIKDKETVYLGKDAKFANLVFTNDYTNVSRMHCSVTFDAKANRYFVIDSSSNGTYLINKKRLEKGKRSPVSVNTVLILANDNCTVLLG